MASNQYVNKVIYGGSTLIDLTSDTVTAADVQSGVTFHLPSGATGTGTCEYDVDSSDCTAAVAEVLTGKTFAKGGQVLTGTMPNRGAVTGTISTKAGTYTIQNGYHDGSGTVGISSTEQQKIIPSNIKSGITILGCEGTYSGEAISATSVSITPSTSTQTILPPSGYDYISQANVAAIPYTETDNAQGGKTVTIG